MPPKIAVLGTSGSGKTTVARELARGLGLPHVELDALFHGPGWTEPPIEEFRRRVAAATDGSGWVVDGNYESSLGDLVLERADTVVWLDLESMFAWTIRSHLRRRRELPRWLAAHPHLRVVRLRSAQEVERYLDM